MKYNDGKEIGMNNINDKVIVKEQYANSNNLNTRISIHEKYSVNKIGFGNWIVSKYEITNGMRVLELGCGTGDMWNNNIDIIAPCAELILTDFSEGMLETAKANVGIWDNITYQVVDMQEIPFKENHFDVVIANMMLYHVPNLDQGLKEVRRVLKKGGKFYGATYGEHGIIEYLSKILSAYGVTDNTNKNFTMQNGKEILEKYFKNVEKLEYMDALEVTDVNDMLDYIASLTSMTTLNCKNRDHIQHILEQHMINGILHVPKEYGIFIAS